MSKGHRKSLSVHSLGLPGCTRALRSPKRWTKNGISSGSSASPLSSRLTVFGDCGR